MTTVEPVPPASVTPDPTGAARPPASPAPLGASPRGSIGRTNPWRTVLVCAAAIAIAFTAAWTERRGLSPAADITRFGALLATLLFASAILERALDVWLTLTHGARADELDARIRAQKAALEAGAATLADGAELERLTVARREHQSRTRRVALPAAFVAGLLVSSVGLRGLQPLFDESVTPDRWFVFVDVLVTGMLLAGGSDGIHWIVALYRDWIDKNRSTKA